MASPDQRLDPQDPTVRLERTIRFWGVILWPSFLAACLLEFMVFAIVDPAELHWPGHVGPASRINGRGGSRGRAERAGEGD
jgi:hypothetical protein